MRVLHFFLTPISSSPCFINYDKRKITRSCSRYVHVLQSGDSRGQGVQVVLVPHLVARSVSGPEFAGVVVGSGTQYVAEGMPGECPHDAVVCLLDCSHLLISTKKQLILVVDRKLLALITTNLYSFISTYKR